MPEHLRALVVVVGLAAVIFGHSKAPACALAMSVADFERRRNVWFAVTLIAFLSHNFWAFIVVSAIVLLFAAQRDQNRLAMYFLLLFAVPAISEEITGLGVIDHFFTINYLRLLSLAVLLPGFLSLVTKPEIETFGRTLADKLLAGYLLLDFALQLQADTLTNALRHGVFYAFLDVFLPYYVASRSLTTLAGFRDALMSFVVAALVVSAIGIFEFGKGWLLYTGLEDALGKPWGPGYYLRRDGNLRALASTGQPIALGFSIAVAIGFSLYLRKSVPRQIDRVVVLMLLSGGLIAALSRGPWVGAVAIVVIFVAAGPSPIVRLAKLGMLGSIAALILMASPAGPTVVDHLPFIGSVDERNVLQRQRLMDVSMQVIMQNPLFGSVGARFSAPMEQLRLGDGLIDIVNSYLRITLRDGLVGLTLFVGVFLAAAVAIFRSMRSLADKEGESHVLGQALLATLFGILLIIYTVSSITVIPVIYWSVVGLGVGYAQMLRFASAAGAAHGSRYRSAGVQSAS